MTIMNWCMAHGVDTQVSSSLVSKGMFINTDYGLSRESYWAESARIEAIMGRRWPVGTKGSRRLPPPCPGRYPWCGRGPARMVGAARWQIPTPAGSGSLKQVRTGLWARTVGASRRRRVKSPRTGVPDDNGLPQRCRRRLVASSPMSTDSEGLGPDGTQTGEPSASRRRFDASFPRLRAVLPVIHAANEAQVLANAEIVRTAGADGVFLINHQGSCDELLTMHAAARARYPEWWIGVNCLGLSPGQTFALVPAKMSTASGPTMQVSMNGTMSRPALSRPPEHRGQRLEWALLRRRRVQVSETCRRPETCSPHRPRSHGRDHNLWLGTGQAADPDKAAAIRAGAGDHPVALRFGVSPPRTSTNTFPGSTHTSSLNRDQPQLRTSRCRTNMPPCRSAVHHHA